MEAKTREIRIGRRLHAAYELIVGAVLVIVGLMSGSAWTTVVGFGMLALGGLTGFSRGEATSWLRGELDERRLEAVNHGFKVGFFVLSWWVAGVAVYASHHWAGAELIGAGNGVAIVAAYTSYGLRLRRS